jgi:adenine-specific DNA-methyltransferase
MSIEPMQVFFPLGGKNEGWAKLAKTLKAEINQELIEHYAGTESLPFSVDGGAMIAVKIIDDRGIESLKVLKVGG